MAPNEVRDKMCIYYGVSPLLTYKNQEHVFPAGLGGNKKLPNDYVSDQANKLFSPMELKLMRSSLISFERMMFGPGDRGSLQPRKASKSLVNVGVQDDKEIVLSYTAIGKPYNIPQIHLYGSSARLSIPSEHGETSQQISQIVDALRKFSGKFVFLPYNGFSEDEMIIGFFEGKYYVSATGMRPSVEYIQEKIGIFLNNFCEGELQKGVHHVQQNYHLVENEEIARVYAKVAMNTLALVKGKEYAMHKNFDEIREWILTGKSKCEFFCLPSLLTNELSHLVKIFPDRSHWCLFSKIGTTLEAMVCFYNCFMRRFTFGEVVYQTDFVYPNGFICDWKNEKEYTLEEFIHVITNTP